MKKKLIILSAKFVADELKGLFGNIPPVMAPFKNQKLIEHLYEKVSNDYEITLVLSEGSELVKNYITSKKYNINVQILEKTNSLADSLIPVLDEKQEITILFGDTLIDGFDLTKYSKDSLGYGIIEESKKWTTFEVKNNELVIYDKVESSSNKAFIGIFSFSDSSLFKQYLVETSDFYKSLVLYNQTNQISMFEEKKWIDLGHIEEYTVNREVATRYFNEIKIDREKGKLVKRSSEKDKFRNEIKWYLKLPNELEYLTPRIFNYNLSYTDLFVEMEYYSYLTLHDSFVHGNLSLNRWNKILDLLLKVNSEFKKYKLELPKQEIDSALNKLYVGKTLDRFNDLKENPEFQQYFEKEITVNGKVYPSLSEITEQLPKIVEDNLLNLDSLSIIHGDYFFANILYDGTSNFIRLIDPRGDFGGYGIYGDWRYDIAKLSHSLNGKYDFIVNDDFDLTLAPSQIEFKINSTPRNEQINDLFIDKLEPGIADQIHLIESLLFLSMVPLHKDFVKRQHVMLATGLIQISKYLK